MNSSRPIKKKITKEFLKQGGKNLSKAVRTVQPELTIGSSHNKAHRMLSSASFWEEINDLSSSLGFSIDNAMTLLVDKARKGDKDSLKALQTWFEVTGNKCPAKTENKTSLDANITQEQTKKICEIARLSRLEALQN